MINIEPTMLLSCSFSDVSDAVMCCGMVKSAFQDFKLKMLTGLNRLIKIFFLLIAKVIFMTTMMIQFSF